MDPESKTGAPAGLFRRLAALLYDLLLAIAIAFVATAAMLPLTHGEAILTATQGFVAHAVPRGLALRRVRLLRLVLDARRPDARHESLENPARDGRGRAHRLGRCDRPLLAGCSSSACWQSSASGTCPGPAARWSLSGAVAMSALAMLNFAWIAFDGGGRSLQDLVGRVRVVRTN